MSKNNFTLDGFDTATLQDGLNSVPIAFGPVAKTQIYLPKPCTNTKIVIESVNETLSLVQSSLRGGPVRPHAPAGRSQVTFEAPHLRLNNTILAASWQGKTAFGKAGTPANVLEERDRILGEHARRLTATTDFMMTRGLGGLILDADGSTLIDVHAEFGITQLAVNCELGVSTTNVTNKIIAARRMSEGELGMQVGSQWIAFCSPGYIDALRAHPSVEAGLAGYAAAAQMLADHRKGSLVIGETVFIEVPNRAGKTYVDDGAAFLVPADVPDLFQVYFAPADYIEAVNSEGLPLYARSEFLDFNRGIEIESQANPVPVCTKPRAVIKLTA